MKHIKIFILIGFLCLGSLLLLDGCKPSVVREPKVKGEIIAQVNEDQISSDFISLIMQEGLTEEEDIKKVVDTAIENILLSEEAIRTGLDESPLVKQRIGRELDHVYISWVLKARFPKKSIKEIRRDFNELSEDLIESTLKDANIEYGKISPAKAILDTKEEKEKRKDIVIATVNQEKVTLQDVLDRFPAYQEQRFFDWDDEYRKEIVLQAIQMKLVKNDFLKIKEKYPVLDEYLIRIKQYILANSLGALYLDPGAEFTKDETSDEFFRIRFPKPTEQDLKGYYEQNPENFKVADRIKVRHIMVEKEEDMDELLSQIQKAKIEKDEDFIRLVRSYSVSLDKERDGDLGYLLNPILHPDSKIPPFIHWAFARTKLFNLKKGEVSPPFRSEEGLHILFVYDREDKLVPFSNDWAKQTCLKYWRRKQRKDSLDDLINRLEAEASIKINEGVLKRIQG